VSGANAGLFPAPPDWAGAGFRRVFHCPFHLSGKTPTLNPDAGATLESQKVLRHINIRLF